LVLVYPVHANLQEIELPDGLLTPKIVLNALDGRLTSIAWGSVLLWGGGAVLFLAGLAVYWRKQQVATT